MQPQIKPKKNLILITNTNCNQSCEYCYYNIGVEKRTNHRINPSELQLFIDTHVNSVSITGGEPLLNPKLFEYLKIVRPLCNKIKLSTNGSLLSVDLLHKLKSAGVSKFYISLDDLRGNIHNKMRSDSRQKILETLKILSRSDAEVTICSVINKQNIHEIFSLEQYCNQNSYNFWPQPLFLPEDNPNYIDLSLKNLSKKDWEPLFARCKSSQRYPKSTIFINKYQELILNKNVVDCPFASDSLVVNADGEIRECFHGPAIGFIQNQTLSQVLANKNKKQRRCLSELCLQYYL